MSDSPGERLAGFRARLGATQAQFAAGLGVSPATVAFIERNERPPSRSFLQKISERYRISADWLLHGTGEMQLTAMPGFAGRRGQIEPTDQALPASGDFRFDGEQFAMIRRMDLSVSAGPGIVPVDNGEAEALAFSRSWLLRNQINADLSVLVRVSGSSMTPGIPDGALVLVHLPEAIVSREGVYAFNLDGESFVKRLIPSGPTADGRWETVMILSDNPIFPPRALTGQALNDLRVVGRVRCVIYAL